MVCLFNRQWEKMFDFFSVFFCVLENLKICECLVECTLRGAHRWFFGKSSLILFSNELVFIFVSCFNFNMFMSSPIAAWSNSLLPVERQSPCWSSAEASITYSIGVSNWKNNKRMDFDKGNWWSTDYSISK